VAGPGEPTRTVCAAEIQNPAAETGCRYGHPAADPNNRGNQRRGLAREDRILAGFKLVGEIEVPLFA
jgi:hypothetical protein